MTTKQIHQAAMTAILCGKNAAARISDQSEDAQDAAARHATVDWVWSNDDIRDGEKNLVLRHARRFVSWFDGSPGDHSDARLSLDNPEVLAAVVDGLARDLEGGA